MINSILQGTKKILGIDKDYDVFDFDIINHINGVFSTLDQLGIGPEEGFSIEDDSAEWSSFTDNKKVLGFVKTYVYLRVRVLFDPPGSSFVQEAILKQIQELEWRLNLYHEGDIE